MFRGGGGGLGRFPMTDSPLDLLIAALILVVLVWFAFRIFQFFSS
jgi:hypothetical protein